MKYGFFFFSPYVFLSQVINAGLSVKKNKYL